MKSTILKGPFMCSELRRFFSQDFFAILKNGQKKCPKMKIRKKSWKKISLNHLQKFVTEKKIKVRH